MVISRGGALGLHGMRTFAILAAWGLAGCTQAVRLGGVDFYVRQVRVRTVEAGAAFSQDQQAMTGFALVAVDRLQRDTDVSASPFHADYPGARALTVTVTRTGGAAAVVTDDTYAIGETKDGSATTIAQVVFIDVGEDCAVKKTLTASAGAVTRKGTHVSLRVTFDNGEKLDALYETAGSVTVAGAGEPFSVERTCTPSGV
jgi:hypothetical protein